LVRDLEQEVEALGIREVAVACVVLGDLREVSRGPVRAIAKRALPVHRERGREVEQREGHPERVDAFRCGLEAAETARGSPEVLHGQVPDPGSRPSGACRARMPSVTIATARFTPTAIEWEEIVALETIVMSTPSLIGSFTVLPMNCRV